MKRLSVIVVVILVVAMVGCVAAFGVQALSKGNTAKVVPSDHGIPGLVDLGLDGFYFAGNVKVVTLTPTAPRATATPGGTK